MANTSLNLGEHWEVFIKNEVASGHYGSASEVVRDALRNLEKHKTRLNALRSHLARYCLGVVGVRRCCCSCACCCPAT